MTTQTTMQTIDVTPLFADLLPVWAVRSPLRVKVTDNSYAPKTEQVVFDWINRVAIPAFRAYRAWLKQEGGIVRSFCTLGTGTGCDALAAAEIFLPRLLAMTDLHQPVVEVARGNVLENLLPGNSLEVHAEVGPLFAPLRNKGLAFDLIYENLPNLPIHDEEELLSGQNSASYFTPGTYPSIPPIVHENRLVLHFAALLHAKEFLARGGAILCSIGARCSVVEILDMVQAAGYHAVPHTFTWKMQSEAREIIAGYALAQGETGRRFVFYLPEAVTAAFAPYTPAEAAKQHEAITRWLKPHEVDAIKAEALLDQGKQLAHTVMVVRATPREVRT